MMTCDHVGACLSLPPGVRNWAAAVANGLRNSQQHALSMSCLHGWMSSPDTIATPLHCKT